MKAFYTIICLICVGVGVVGVVLPVLPTAPFLLLASFFLAIGSDRFYNWFLSTGLYKKHLGSFVKNRSMKLKTKVVTLTFASTMLLLAFLAMDNIYIRTIILILVAFKYYYFIFHIETLK